MTPGFRGVYSVLVTPFTETGHLDLAALERVVDFSVVAGAHGLVTPVVVSEFFTLSDAERRAVVETAVAATAGRVPVVAGVSAPSIHGAAVFAEHAADAGADAVIAVPPYVKRATWTETVGYFEAIADAGGGLPVFVQNADGPSGTPLSPGQLLELADRIEAVSWIKEESSLSSQTISAVLSRPGTGVLGIMGGKGARYALDEYQRGICGTMPGCEFTDLHVALWDALESGDHDRAGRIYRLVLPLVEMEDQYGGAAFCKEVLRMRGVLTSTFVREPGSLSLDRLAVDLLARHLNAAEEPLTRSGYPSH
ncbi:dihydrodipicolinate synthase family protein [Jiangella aurantiaca]|uniref:Dihydrodipicolinate synthase family protein n=1 Tax=Jiangella aurantiaca TaxID=2530373 RepID=A0A4R5AJ49_9ACTN|nr:dihydrodipicolinate synthase family protein [Jiangella aurantiaca]TDD72581.1 dihydrodipicolinate synthase family protein [Jiangella aurantiaca]